VALDEVHEPLLGLCCLKTLFFSFLYSFGPFSLLLVFSFGFFLDFDSLSKKSGKFLRTGSLGAGCCFSAIGLLDSPCLLLPTSQLRNDSTSPFNIGVILSFKSGLPTSLRLGLTSAFNLGVKPLTRVGVVLFELVLFLSRRLEGVPANLRFDLLVFTLMLETSESGDAGGLSGPSYNLRPIGREITSEVKEENWSGVGGGEWGGGEREGLWGRELLYGRERSQLESEAPGSKRLSTEPRPRSPELGATEDPMMEITPASPTSISFPSMRRRASSSWLRCCRASHRKRQ